MARNSVTGCFRDIEIAFSNNSNYTTMSVRNLVDTKKRVRVMYQKLAMSGLANWTQFELSNTPIMRRLPTEILEAYRLTFFIDNAEPVSARIEKILDELSTLKAEQPAETTPEDTTELNVLKPESLMQTQDEVNTPVLKGSEDTMIVSAVPPLQLGLDADEHSAPEVQTTQQIERTVVSVPEIEPLKPVSPPLETFNDENVPSAPEIEATEQVKETTDMPEVEIPKPVATSIDEDNYSAPEAEAAQLIEESAVPSIPKVVVPGPSKIEQQPEARRAPTPIVSKLSSPQNAEPAPHTVDANAEFKIAILSLPPSALAEQRKAEAAAKFGTGDTKYGMRSSKRKEKGVIRQFVQALGITAGSIRGKIYYREKGEAIQSEFQNQLAKLERDCNEGYGLNLLDWDPETLCEEEIAILILNLMVNEVIAWRKETGRATHETEQLVQTLDEVDTRLRQILKQTRGISTPSPTLFPDLLAENERDLEKIQSECDAYLQRFASKLAEQEKKHASKIQVIIFKKFLIEFIRDFLFVEIAKNIRGNALPKRLKWFLNLVDSEVIPIEIGITQVSPNYHKVKCARSCEFEPGTIVEVVTPGLQSKDGKRVSQTAVVIEAE